MCFSHPIPPIFLISGMYPPKYNISECTSQVGQLLLESSKRTGLSLSLYLYLSRSGWFHDEVAKKPIKPKKAARSLPPSLGYGCQLTFVAIVRLKGTCTSYRARTTGPNSGSNEYGTTKVLAHLPIFDSLPPWMSAGKGPAKLVPGRAGPCLLTALPHTAQSKHKVLADLAPRYISTLCY